MHAASAENNVHVHVQVHRKFLGIILHVYYYAHGYNPITDKVGF